MCDCVIVIVIVIVICDADKAFMARWGQEEYIIP